MRQQPYTKDPRADQGSLISKAHTNCNIVLLVAKDWAAQIRNAAQAYKE